MGTKALAKVLAGLKITEEDAKRLDSAADALRTGPLLFGNGSNIYFSTVILIGIQTIIALFKEKPDGSI